MSEPSTEDAGRMGPAAGHSLLMATGTVLSRITGMARDIALVAAIGTAVFADAFSVANTLPTIVYILLVGGALNAIFIPQLVRRMADDEDHGRAYADRLLTLVASVLVVITVLAVLAAPWIVSIYGSTQWSDTDAAVSVAFARYCLPQILFFGIYTMLAQVLNARGIFGAPMFAPIANNIVVIATLALFIGTVGYGSTTSSITDGEIALLGLGSSAGVVVQALVLIPALRRVGFRWRLRFDWRNAGLGRALGLATWTMALVVVNQITYAVVTRLATTANVEVQTAGAAAVGFTSYVKAHLLFMLPHSVITVSIVTALLPRMSRAAHEGRLRDVAADVAEGARVVLAIIVPAAAALIATGPVIGRVLYGHGSTSLASGEQIGVVLVAFAFGLPAFSLYYVLLRGYYALEDTRTPFLQSLVLAAVNIAGALGVASVLPARLQVIGLASAYSLAYLVTVLMAWQVLSRRLGGLEGRSVLRTAVRVVLAAAIPASALTVMVHERASAGVVFDLITVIAAGLALLVIYVPLARLMRVSQVQQAIDLVRSRLSR